jgi:hypothetical protein
VGGGTAAQPGVLPGDGTVPSVTQTLPGGGWLEQFAAHLGVEPPTEQEVDDLLALAGVAAHASERIAAPISCWLVARAGITAAEGRARAQALAARIEEG